MGTLQMRATLPFLLLTCTIVLHPRVSPRKGQHLLCTEGSDWTLPWDWSVHSFLETNPFFLNFISFCSSTSFSEERDTSSLYRRFGLDSHVGLQVVHIPERSLFDAINFLLQ